MVSLGRADHHCQRESLQRKCLDCAVWWWGRAGDAPGIPTCQYLGAVLWKCCLPNQRFSMEYAIVHCFSFSQNAEKRGEMRAVITVAQTLMEGAERRQHKTSTGSFA